MKPRKPTEAQARDHLARQLALGDAAKAERIKALPLFRVALIGAGAL